MSHFSLRIVGSILRELSEGRQACLQLQGGSSRALRQELRPQGPAVRHRGDRAETVAAEQVKPLPSSGPCFEARCVHCPEALTRVRIPIR
jgi:hypothetical protein